MSIDKETTEHINYPNRYELNLSLAEFCSRDFVDHFAQGKGIFIANATTKEISAFLSNIFYEYGDIEDIHSAALHISENRSLSGFWAEEIEKGIGLVNELEASVGNIVDERSQMRLGAIIEKKGLGEQIYCSHVGYTQKQPGRVEFLSEIPREFEFYIKQLDENKWEILVDGNRAQDTQTLADWFEGKARKNYRLVTIDQALFSKEIQTIQFFDELSKSGMQDDWRFSQVRRITLRKPPKNADDEEEIEEATQT